MLNLSQVGIVDLEEGVERVIVMDTTGWMQIIYCFIQQQVKWDLEKGMRYL